MSYEVLSLTFYLLVENNPVIGLLIGLFNLARRRGGGFDSHTLSRGRSLCTSFRVTSPKTQLICISID
jgi:hypothetical protein